MRISLHSGSTLYPLAGEGGVSERTHSSVADFQLTPESEVQVAAFVRGAYAKPIDRGNLLNVVSFTTTRQFATPAAAELWCLDYHGSFPSSGTLYFDAVAPNGTVSRRTMENAVVDPPRRRCIGATALVDYTVRGGSIAVGSAESYPTTITVSGVSSPSGANSTWSLDEYAPVFNGRPNYNSGIYWIQWSGTRWEFTTDMGTDYFYSTENVDDPTLVTSWTNGPGAAGTLTVT
jgi:hypothetical protein